jgi:MFS family permease
MPQILLAPPYLLTSSGLGLFTVSSFIGIVIGYPIAGPMTDLLSRSITRMSRDKVHLPEYRIPALIIPFLICPAGCILLAYTLAHGGSIYIAAVGFAMQVSAMVFVPSVVLSVVMDGWPANGSEAMVLINAGKNLVAFGVTVESSKWLMKEGLVKMFWEMAGMQWAVLVFAVPLFFLGPWLRQKSMLLV